MLKGFILFNFKLENKKPLPLDSIHKVIKKAQRIVPREFLYYVEKYFEEGFTPFI